MAGGRQLRRSRHNRLCAGVCGGLGEYFGLTPWWFRLMFGTMALSGLIPAVLVYLICWKLIPEG
jgi:phage shock protein C